MKSDKTVIRQDSELPDDLQEDLWALQPSIQEEGLVPESIMTEGLLEPEPALQYGSPVVVAQAF